MLKTNDWSCHVSQFFHLNVTCACLSGMVLVRTELGQLVMVPQQALAQVQAQAQAQAQNSISPRPGTPTSGAPFRVTTPQVRPQQRYVSCFLPSLKHTRVQGKLACFTLLHVSCCTYVFRLYGLERMQSCNFLQVRQHKYLCVRYITH